MKRIKVAHITTVDQSLRYLLLNQLCSIREAGYDVAGISSAGPEVAEIEAAGIRHIAVPMSRNFTPLADLAALWRLYSLMRRERFTIVHTHNPKPGLLGQMAARMAGVPVVVNTLHGFYFHDHMRPQARRFYIILEKIAALCSDVILSQNSEDIEVAVREDVCPPGKIKYLGNGIDLSVFDLAQIGEKRARKRQELGIPENARVVGFVGRLAARRKGFLDFLRAGQCIVERDPGIRFLIVGEPDHGKPDAVEPSTAKEYGIWEHCHFVGQRPNAELPSLYAAMDVLVLPSLFEGMPRVVMEASAMGVPVVATDVKGNREAVEAGANGLLVPLGDVQALADAILAVLTDVALAKRMGEQGRRLALERFDERLVFNKIKAEYADLLRAREAMTRQRRSALYSKFGKRLLDITISAALLVVLAPVFALVAMLVRLLLGSPVLFRQQRPGKRRRPFTLVKFRTMTDERDARGKLLPDDKRLTAFGRFLRSASLDELPELWNVLKGDMSLVGPRPLLMQYLSRYTPEQMRRHEVKPGITGWAQVNGRNALSWEHKFALDLWYVERQSLALDLRILLLTLKQVLGRQSISLEGHATMPEFMGSGQPPEGGA